MTNTAVADRMEADRQANAQTLKNWVEQVSDGFFTSYVDERSHKLSIVRADGQPLGGYESFNEFHPITGMQTGIYVGAYRLDRRNRKEMAAVLSAVRGIVYGHDFWDEESYGLARWDLGRYDWLAGDKGAQSRYGRFVMAMFDFERRNHLENVKP